MSGQENLGPKVPFWLKILGQENVMPKILPDLDGVFFKC